MKAIYRPVVTDSQVQAQDTLVYNLRDGFTWVRFSGTGPLISGDWYTFAASAPAAEKAAREAGLDPQAILYV